MGSARRSRRSSGDEGVRNWLNSIGREDDQAATVPDHHPSPTGSRPVPTNKRGGLKSFKIRNVVTAIGSVTIIAGLLGGYAHIAGWIDPGFTFRDMWKSMTSQEETSREFVTTSPPVNTARGEGREVAARRGDATISIDRGRDVLVKKGGATNLLDGGVNKPGLVTLKTLSDLEAGRKFERIEKGISVMPLEIAEEACHRQMQEIERMIRELANVINQTNPTVADSRTFEFSRFSDRQLSLIRDRRDSITREARQIAERIKLQVNSNRFAREGDNEHPIRSRRPRPRFKDEPLPFGSSDEHRLSSLGNALHDINVSMKHNLEHVQAPGKFPDSSWIPESHVLLLPEDDLLEELSKKVAELLGNATSPLP